MRIDAHTHAYAETVIADPVAWAQARQELHWLDLVAPQGKHSLQGWVTQDEMLADMDAAGIDRAFLLGWYWQHAQTCEEQNGWYADWIARYPQRFSAFASVNPSVGSGSLDTVKRAHDRGFIGIGEMHAGVQGFPMQEPAWLAIVEFAIENNMSINFHVTEPVGRPHAGRIPTPFADFQWLATEYPELKIILSHLGGLLPFYELNPYVKKIFRNVFYDTAALPLLYQQQVLRSVLDVVGVEKILYGSDYPLIVYPKNNDKPDFLKGIDAVQMLGLAEDELDALLGGNAEKMVWPDFRFNSRRKNMKNS